MINPQGILELDRGIWGFGGLRREARSVAADSRAFYVDPHSPLANDGNSGEDPVHPLATIQQAVTMARAYQGDVIYVLCSDQWRYGLGTETGIVETVVVPRTKPGLRIVGVGGGPLGVYWEPAAESDFALTVNALDVIVEGFCFFDGALTLANGVFLNYDGVTYNGDNGVVSACSFHDLQIGVQLEYSWYSQILNCYFEDCVDGIMTDTAGSGALGTLIKGNWFNDCTGAAMSLLGGFTYGQIVENLIWNTTALGAGAATDEGIVTTAGGHNLVARNTFSCLDSVPANGDWDDLNSGVATDVWVANQLIDAINSTTPT